MTGLAAPVPSFDKHVAKTKTPCDCRSGARSSLVPAGDSAVDPRSQFGQYHVGQVLRGADRGSAAQSGDGHFVDRYELWAADLLRPAGAAIRVSIASAATSRVGVVSRLCVW